MKNTKRSAFTIVELVIVIAVIAILSAVLIPTFGAIIKDANEAADQATAATLTSELHVYLKGETIDSEEELMAKLQDSGIGEKLVPKALGFGHHFWFDMENQMIVAGYVEDIEKIGKEETPAEQTAQTEGVALVSAVLTADVSAESSFGGLRNLFPHNDYYLITAESALSTVFGDMSAIEDAPDYLAFVTELSEATEDEVFGDIATYVFNNFKKTVIINNYGMFHYAGVTDASVYFAPGIQVLKANRVVYDEALNGASNADGEDAIPTIAGGVINLPKSVISVESDALNFGADTIIKTSISSVENLASVLGKGATNSIVEIANGTRYTLNQDVNEDGFGDQVVRDLTNQNNVASDFDKLIDADNKVVFSVSGRLPYDAFEIIAITKTDYIDWNDGILYISYEEGKTVQLYAATSKTAIDTCSMNVKSWTLENDDNSVISVNENGLLTINNPTKDNHTAKIFATAININGTEVSNELTVVINKAESANVKVGTNVYRLGNGLSHEFTWTYINTDSRLAPVGDSIKYFEVTAQGDKKIDIELPEDSAFELTDEGDLAFVNVSGSTTFTISVDGALRTTFTANVADNSRSPFEVKYRNKSHGDTYLYYVGADVNEIKLSDLFSVKSGESFTSGTLTIYDDFYYGGIYDSTVGINQTDDVLSASFGSDIVTSSVDLTSSNWSNYSIKFNAVNTSDDTIKHEAFIEIVPDDSGYTTLLVKIVVVENAKNVYDVAGIISATNDHNAVLLSDCTATTGQQITVGSGKTFYGNGFVITANVYAAEEKQITDKVVTGYDDKCTVCNDKATDNCYKSTEEGGHATVEVNGCNTTITSIVYDAIPIYEDQTKNAFKSDVALITVSGGAIDNIYVDGPVYSALQYDANEFNASDGKSYVQLATYVSGVKLVGNSSIYNSYVSGFRQPVQVTGDANTTAYVENTTLRGGNFANLQVVNGNLKIKDVTTVQDQNGMQATFGDTDASVVGCGIVLDRTAISSKITIEGYLDQFNWIKNGQEADMPNVKGIDLGQIFGFIFDGVDVIITEIQFESLWDYIHEVKDANNNEFQYVNMGIMFIALNEGDGLTYSMVKTVGNNITHINRTSEGKIDLRYPVAMPVPQISKYTMAGMNVGQTLIDMFLNGYDPLINIISYEDGQNWTSDSNGDWSCQYDAYSANTVQLKDGTRNPIKYIGYYDGTGYYATEYNNSANDFNK